MKTKSPRQIPFLVAVVFGLAAPPLAHAVPTLRLSDGVSTVTIADGGVGDSNPVAGAVTFIGPIGSFSTNVSTGLSKPVLGSATLPFLDLSSVNFSSGPAGGTLTIGFSDNFFGPTPGGVTANIGGTTARTVSYSTFADASNLLFGTFIPLTSQGPFGAPAFSGTTFATLGLLSPFSLTQEVVIIHTAAGAASFNAELKAVPKAVPDGGSTVALLGGVLVGLESLRRRFRVP
jgi:VPDSG-CTERM motif